VCPCKEHTTDPADRPRLTALHCGVFNPWGPTSEPDDCCPEGVRDNDPGLHSQAGGLSKDSRDHECESWAQAPLPLHIRHACADAPLVKKDARTIAHFQSRSIIKFLQKGVHRREIAAIEPARREDDSKFKASFRGMPADLGFTRDLSIKAPNSAEADLGGGASRGKSDGLGAGSPATRKSALADLRSQNCASRVNPRCAGDDSGASSRFAAPGTTALPVSAGLRNRTQRTGVLKSGQPFDCAEIESRFRRPGSSGPAGVKWIKRGNAVFCSSRTRRCWPWTWR